MSLSQKTRLMVPLCAVALLEPFADAPTLRALLATSIPGREALRRSPSLTLRVDMLSARQVAGAFMSLIVNHEAFSRTQGARRILVCGRLPLRCTLCGKRVAGQTLLRFAVGAARDPRYVGYTCCVAPKAWELRVSRENWIRAGCGGDAERDLVMLVLLALRDGKVGEEFFSRTTLHSGSLGADHKIASLRIEGDHSKLNQFSPWDLACATLLALGQLPSSLLRSIPPGRRHDRLCDACGHDALTIFEMQFCRADAGWLLLRLGVSCCVAPKVPDIYDDLVLCKSWKLVHWALCH